MRAHGANEATKRVIEVADLARTAVDCRHHHHNDAVEATTEHANYEEDLESLRSENRQLKNLLEQNVKLLQNISESPGLPTHCPPSMVQEINNNRTSRTKEQGPKSSSKDKEETMQESASGRVCAKWDNDVHLKFVELCEEEIVKGNKPNTHLSKDGWKNMLNKFNKATSRQYDRKQMKNHWDHMKVEWTLFKQLIKGETGLVWDDAEKTFLVDNAWWDRKIKENSKYKRFRKKDLSLLWFRYDKLFSDIVDIGESTRVLSQEQISEIKLDQEDEGINDIDGSEREPLDRSYFERQDESDDLQDEDYDNFCEPTGKRQKSRGDTDDQVKKSKSNSSSMSLKQNMQSLLELMSNRNTATSPYSPHVASGPTIEKCVDILKNITGIIPGSHIWNYACNLLCQKEMRQMFVLQPNDEARLSWLKFNYQLFVQSNPRPST